MSHESANQAVTENPIATPGPSQHFFDYRVVDVGLYVRLLWRGRFIVILYAILGGILATAYAYYLHPLYDATVRLMPPDHSESVIASLSAARNSGDLYLGLISSRTVADDVIEHQHLKEYFHTEKPTPLHNALAGMAKISVDKDQFVTVTVRAAEPETAVRVANEFPAALYRLNHAVAISRAGHRFEYFAGPLEQESRNLADAEEALKEAQQKTGMVMPQEQVQLGLTAIASLKGQITNLNEQLAALLTGSTDQNPEVIRLRTEIGSLSAQEHRLEAQNGGPSRAVASGDLPALTLEIERKTREVKLHEALFEVLTHQYENARVEDSYSPPIELVDRAVLPDQKAFPPRKQYMLVGLLVGAAFGILSILMRATRPIRKLREFLREPAASSRA